MPLATSGIKLVRASERRLSDGLNTPRSWSSFSTLDRIGNRYHSRITKSVSRNLMAKFGRGQVGGLQFARVLGGTPRAGSSSAKLYTYTVYVQRDIKGKLAFTNEVDEILADKRGWIRGNKVAFQRVAKEGNTVIVLARPPIVDQLCAPLKTEGEVSCCLGSRIVINLKRWADGVPHWDGSVQTYRQMLINHEMGHRIGRGHGYCEGPGSLAPVMQQQTYGLQGCKGNSWPLTKEL